MPTTTKKCPARISDSNIFVKSSIAKNKKPEGAAGRGLIYKANLKILLDVADEINKKREEKK